MYSEHPRHTAVVGALVRDDSGRILLVRHHRRGWEIPQGRVEEGEGLLEALRREVREEAGVEVEPGPLACLWSKLSPPSALIFTFLARYTSGEPTPCGECPEIGWFDPAGALAAVTHPVNRDRLEALLAFDGTLLFRSYIQPPYRVLEESSPTGGS